MKRFFLKTTVFFICAALFCAVAPDEAQAQSSAGIIQNQELKCAMKLRYGGRRGCEGLERNLKVLEECREYLSEHNLKALNESIAKARAENDCPDMQSAGSCDYDDAVVAYEEEAFDLADRGERIKKIAGMDLPFYPAMSFSVSTSGTDISLKIDDPDSWWQTLLDKSRQVNSFLGWFEGKTVLFALPTFDGMSGNYYDYYPNLLNTINLVADQIETHRKTGSEKKEGGIPEHIIAMGRALQSARDIRKGMVCTTKLHLKKFYEDYETLKQERLDLLEKIDGNAACKGPDGGKGAGYHRVINAKRDVVYDVHEWIEGSNLTSYDGSRPDGFVNKTGGWADDYTVMAKADCSGYELKNAEK